MVFSGIVVSIILVLGAYLYQFYYHTIYKDYVNANESYLSSIQNRHENEMAILDDIVLQMGFPNGNTEFKLKESPQKCIALEKQLYSYASVNQFFFQLYYFYSGDSYLYNQNTSVSMERFLNNGFKLESVSEEELRAFIYDPGKKLRVLKEQPVGGYLTQKFHNIAQQAVVYGKAILPKGTSTMLFAVSSTYYDKLLGSNTDDLRQNYIIYDNQVITTRGTLNLNSNPILEQVDNMTDSSEEIELDGDKYLITLQQGESGLTYCTVQSKKVFQNKIVTGQWGILFVISICSIPTSLAIVALFRRLWRKIRNINQLLNEDEDNFYNLETIETGIRTLVETNREIHQESLLLRRTRFISSFVRNEYSGRKAAVRAGEKVNLYVDTDYYVVLLMGDRGNSNENKAHEMMLSVITEQEDEDGYGIHLIQNNRSLFVIFGNDVQSIKILTEKIFTIGKKYCEEFVMSASGTHKNFEEASAAYLEAAAAYDNRFLVDNERLICFTDVADREQVELLPDTYVQRLKNAIRIGDGKESEKVIEEICDRMRSSRQSLLAFRMFYNDIIHMMIAELKMGHRNFGDIYNVFTLSQCLTIKDFNDILSDVCHKLMDAKDESVTERKDMVSKAIGYMKENYQSSDLNMSALAEHLHVSGVTLAVEFKNIMGISPSEYLAIIRMEHAKALLKETTLRVKEVSIAVGYEDDHVFMRRFKKYVGKTPGEYRKAETEAV